MEDSQPKLATLSTGLFLVHLQLAVSTSPGESVKGGGPGVTRRKLFDEYCEIPEFFVAFEDNKYDPDPCKFVVECLNKVFKDFLEGRMRFSD